MEIAQSVIRPQLTIHWNTEIPRVTDYGISIRTKGELLVDVKPDITLSDATVMKFDVDTRQCYKIGEFPLQYFHYYTSRKLWKLNLYCMTCYLPYDQTKQYIFDRQEIASTNASRMKR